MNIHNPIFMRFKRQRSNTSSQHIEVVRLCAAALVGVVLGSINGIWLQLGIFPDPNYYAIAVTRVLAIPFLLALFLSIYAVILVQREKSNETFKLVNLAALEPWVLADGYLAVSLYRLFWQPVVHFTRFFYQAEPF